jgi:hypothetical protein
VLEDILKGFGCYIRQADGGFWVEQVSRRQLAGYVSRNYDYQGNYITNTSQTGLEAISNPYGAGQTNPNDAEDILDLTVDKKQTGEYLSKTAMDTLQFNVEQMVGLTPLKYSVTQTYIRAAIIEYVLFKWYELNRLTDSMAMKYRSFEDWVLKLRNNSLSNQKAIRTKKPYRLF